MVFVLTPIAECVGVVLGAIRDGFTNTRKTVQNIQAQHPHDDDMKSTIHSSSPEVIPCCDY